MILHRKVAAGLGAMALVAHPQLAAAQDAACITEQEVAAMVTYAAPSALQAVQARCAAELSGNGFLATEGAALSARYRVLQAEAWPQAKSGLLKVVGDEAAGEDEMLSTITTLPDEAVQPFIDALIAQELGEEIPLEDCRKVERVVEALAPWQLEDMSNLLAVVLSLAGMKDPAICPVRSA